MQIVGTYMWASGNLHWSTDRWITWPGINGTAPRDVPVCGFTGIDGICAASVISTKNVAVAAALASMLFLTGSTICLRLASSYNDHEICVDFIARNPLHCQHHPIVLGQQLILAKACDGQCKGPAQGAQAFQKCCRDNGFKDRSGGCTKDGRANCFN
ncbi:hypothetical protein BV898_14713 [Hypsibius exemplaris]|uniref:Uncharacterized protein n=1 Tax=Hypsibius exemplaris TaxID=2072580 RepID=A0A9X6NB38_HYPEX|nr:hypothetical protein BV898_14713 [Hypsibius exemplaris]